MTASQIVEQLERLGSASYRRTLLNHGVREPVIGVKIEELKKIQARVKHDYQLALDLYETGIYDARYLAGLVADDSRMTKRDLRRWLRQANCDALLQFTVPWVAAASRHGLDLAREWIDAGDEAAAVAGWSTFSSLVATRDDALLDLGELRTLLRRVGSTIHSQPKLVPYVMNGFVIAVGSYVAPLTGLALETAAKIGTVEVDLPGECRLPAAAAYIRKVQQRGAIGKKRKSTRC